VANAAPPSWERSNGTHAIQWDGSVWTLDHSNGRVGLRPSDGSSHRLLQLEGLAATGRREDDVFTADSLVHVETLHSRVYATFHPKGWHGLTVRAAWGSSREGGGLDLEIQAATSSVGELEKLEIIVGSTWSASAAKPTSVIVEPRDRRSASLSYDGREGIETLRRLTTLPIPESESTAFAPIVTPVETALGTRRYLEMVHPHDASRRCVEKAGDQAVAARYALFGFDLEKGVVLRGRLRGLWLGDSDAPEAQRRRFLSEPLPLGVV